MHTPAFHIVKIATFAFLFCILIAAGLSAQTFTPLASFHGDNGSGPDSSLIQGTDGNFHGTALGGGTTASGTIFKVTSGGTLTTAHNFQATDGSAPLGALAMGTSGNFYGTTSAGGVSSFCRAGGCGSVFKITPKGQLVTLYSF